jgi:hypothetical protein
MLSTLTDFNFYSSKSVHYMVCLFGVQFYDPFFSRNFMKKMFIEYFELLTGQCIEL